jgi:hypothetical protein
MKQAKWRALQKDLDVLRWYDNVARGSATTAIDRIRLLARYVAYHHTTPGKLVERARKDRKAIEDQLSDFIGTLEKQSKSPGYILNYVKAVKSYLDFHEIRLVRKFKVRNAGATPTLDEERVPSKDELRSILSGASTRGRVVISFLAFAGLRPEVLGNYGGSDGLRLGDLPEVRLVGKELTFPKIPTVVFVRPELSKAGHRYLTFLPAEGCDYLKAYLEPRLASGEKLGPDSPIVRPTPGFEDSGWRAKVADRSFIVTKNVTSDVRRAMRPRFMWRPYVLRAYFDTQMLLAESHGKVTAAYRAFWMGHKGDIDARYTTNKGRLPETIVEDMRKAFQSSEIFLTTEASHVADVKETLLQAFREQARAYGIDPLKVRIEKERAATKLAPDDEIRLLTIEIAKRTAPQFMRPGAEYTNGEGRRNKILKGERLLVRHLDHGWELVSNLGADKYLVRMNP